MGLIIVEANVNVNIVVARAKIICFKRKPSSCFPDSGLENVRAYLRDLSGPSFDP
jgi:hypothetical protein